MTPNEVRMLDNQYAILFISGERPVMDFKYDILKHSNVALTADGKAEAYRHGTIHSDVASIEILDKVEERNRKKSKKDKVDKSVER